MSKPPKTQWNFGELFPTEAIRKVLTVSEITTQVKRLLEKQVGEVWVTGEVTNFRAQSSGHLYFTLKDAECQLSCVLFRNEARESRAFLQDGRKVILKGDLTVYEPRGQYQLRVVEVELQGIGALQLAFEKLKQKLLAEGLFAQERKRPLPRYPRRIGIVTSPTGAALRDILHVIGRRHPGLEIVIATSRVQGQGASSEIAAAIRLLNEYHGPGTELDLILVTRGGGSLEDLWAFNEEAVARAIFESMLPIISAVGHEIDFTISDFVADLRAATPSAGAELITEGAWSSRHFVAGIAGRIGQLVRQRLADKQYELSSLHQRLLRVSPRRQLNEWFQRLDDLQQSLARSLRQGTRHRQVVWRNLRERLSRLRPAQAIRKRRELFELEQRRFSELAKHHLKNKHTKLTDLETRLRLLSPEQVLARGYSITTHADTGKVIRSASQVKPGMRLKTRLKTGEAFSVAEENSSAK